MGGEGLLGSVSGALGQFVERCNLVHLLISYEVRECTEKIQDRGDFLLRG